MIDGVKTSSIFSYVSPLVSGIYVTKADETLILSDDLQKLPTLKNTMSVEHAVNIAYTMKVVPMPARW